MKFLSRVGGPDLKKVVHSILKKIFSQEVSEGINFTGRNGKNAFKPMKLRQVILGMANFIVWQLISARV